MIFFGFLDFSWVSFLICRCACLLPKKENAVFLWDVFVGKRSF